jgi:hypothetical protein
MGFFRRRNGETLNEQLLREAHLDRPEEPPEPVADVWVEALRGAFERSAEYDLIVSLDVPLLSGDEIEFAALPSGELLVDEEQGDGDLSPLADEVEQEVGLPYRVVARREEGDRWKIAAREIDVIELTLGRGDEIELVCEGGVRELRVDGEPSTAEIPELARAEEALGSDYVVQGDRLDGTLWEIRASPL